MVSEMKFLRSLHSPIYVFWTFFALILSLVIWASVFEIEKSVSATGVISPLGKTISIQSLISGRVSKINFKVGDQVNLGEEVVNFDIADQLNQREEMILKINNLNASVLRLSATLNRQKFKNDDQTIDSNTFFLQGQIFDTEQVALENELNVLNVEKSNTQEKLKSLSQQKISLINSKELAKKREKLVKKLYEKGFEGEIALLEAQQEVADVDNQDSQLTSEMIQLEGQIRSIDQQHSKTISNFMNSTAVKLFDTQSELKSLKSNLRLLNSQIDNQKIISPVTGIVTKVISTGQGEVVDAGAALLEVIPEGVPLAFYAEIPSNYVSEINIGLTGRLNLENMDKKTKSALGGILRQVDGDASQREDKTTFYQAIISIDDQANRYLIPGVKGVVSLTLGMRTVIGYFMEPIINALQNSLRES